MRIKTITRQDVRRYMSMTVTSELTIGFSRWARFCIALGLLIVRLGVWIAGPRIEYKRVD